MLLIVIIGASMGGSLLSLADRLARGRPKPRTWSGRMMAGTVPGVLLRVARPCVLGAALWVAGAVGLVEVVTGGDVVTL